jgi:GNAT superfamily N-acetyltransferase
MSQDNLSATQFNVSYEGMKPDLTMPDMTHISNHHLVAKAGDKQIGVMQLMPGGEIAHVEVEDDHQRKGVATSLWKHAQEIGLNPSHSGIMSDEGYKWAKGLHKKGLSEKPVRED